MSALLNSADICIKMDLTAAINGERDVRKQYNNKNRVAVQ